MKKKLTTIIAVLVLLFVPTLIFAGDDVNPGDIIINEFMVDPASPIVDTDGEWIEIHNTTVTVIDIDGWILKDAGGFFEESVTINNSGPLTVPAHGKIVLCSNGNSIANGGISCDYVYGATFTLSNLGDEIILEDATGEVARIDYSGAAPFNGTGQSAYYIPSDTLPAGGYFEDNGNVARWGATGGSSANLYGTSGTNFGTPGAVNDQSGNAPTALTLNTFTGESVNGTSLLVSVVVLLLMCSGLFVFWRSKEA